MAYLPIAAFLFFLGHRLAEDGSFRSQLQGLDLMLMLMQKLCKWNSRLLHMKQRIAADHQANAFRMGNTFSDCHCQKQPRNLSMHVVDIISDGRAGVLEVLVPSKQDLLWITFDASASTAVQHQYS